MFLFPYPDQEKADLKADDTGQVGEGQETAGTKKVWQKGWFLFCMFSVHLWISFTGLGFMKSSSKKLEKL